MSPKISFITVCYKTPNLIRVLLRGVENARLGVPFEYFLVDNGGDGTAEMVRSLFPWVKVIESGANIGFGAANNLAIRQSSGDYVMLVNPDLVVFPNEIEKFVAFMDEHPDVGLAGPRVENPNGQRQESCTRFPSPLMPLYSRTVLGKTSWGKRAMHNYLMRDTNHEEAHESDSVYGASVLIRKHVINQIGAFDERFFMYYEDVDLCRRAWMHGWKVSYVPSARFVHYHQRQSHIRTPWEIFTNRTARVHITSGVRYFLKYRGIPQPPRARHGEVTYVKA